MFEETNQAEIAAEETTLQDGEELNGLLPFELFEKQSAAEQDNTLRVKYNGQEHNLSLGDAVMYAQKGMNYDHVSTERERYSALLDTVAAREGMSRDEYIAMLEGGNDAETTRWMHLLELYPQLDTRTLTSEFFTGIDNGETPTEAYQRVLIDELNTKLKMSEQNEQNRLRAIGSAEGDAQDKDGDNFLEGFLGAKY